MGKKINLQQYRNYSRGWKYLIRIMIYVSILLLILIFTRYKLPKNKVSTYEEEIGIEVFITPSKE